MSLIAPHPESFQARARVVAEIVAPLASRIEADRRLPPEVVRALVDAGIFKMLVPKTYGGGEAPMSTALDVIEAVARADGSAGWCAMIGGSSGIISAFLDADVAREVYGPRDAISCGVFAPMGRAVAVDGGWRVSGRWPFASGCEHSGWRMGGAMIAAESPAAPPQTRCMLFRADETRIHQTWDTSGLRGTGSHDIEVSDVFVPASRSFSFLEPPKHAGGAQALHVFGALASGVAAVALGIGRAAIDAFVELAKAKQPLGAKKSLAHREMVQLHVARAEGKVRGARAMLREAVARAEDEAIQRGAPSLEARALVRVAASHAALESAAAVDLMYEAGGASSIYARSPLQRHFRDVHVATQHVMVSATSATQAGRVLLGLESDTSTL